MMQAKLRFNVSENDILKMKNREIEEMLNKKEDIEKSDEDQLQKLAVRFNRLEVSFLQNIFKT